MIIGSVTTLHAIVPLRFAPPGRPERKIDFVIDTGFTGSLTLPPAVIAGMGLPLLNQIPADLANGATVQLRMYGASVIWDGVVREVTVLGLDHHPLLGTALLDGHELVIQFVESGSVTVDTL